MSSTRLTARFWAALLALTVLFHAAAPFDAPLVARTGSAFSAATVDLAVAPERRLTVQRVALPVAPPPVLLAPLPAAPPLLEFAHAWPPQTAPPAPAPLLLRPAPRAPPIT
nr:hypothetical protein [Novosphingobium hassiacum]